jgi:anti-sigma B factor antagonist
MKITEEPSGDLCLISLEGRLDNESTQNFQETVSKRIDTGSSKLVMDMRQLDYISSVGLRGLLIVSKKLKPLGGKLVMFGLQAHIKDVFDIAGFSSLFPAYPDQEEAVRHISG